MRRLIVAAALAAIPLSVPGLAAAAAGATHYVGCPPATTSTITVTGCTFDFYYGNGAALTTFTVEKFKATVSGAGNEVEVYGGQLPVEVTVGTRIVYTAVDNPSGDIVECPSLVFPEKLPTVDWSLTIKGTGSWNLTCNFSKSG